MRCSITGCICKPDTNDVSSWDGLNISPCRIKFAFGTYGGVSNPIIIIWAKALKKDQLHCVDAFWFSSPAYTTQLSSGNPCSLTSIKLKQPIQCPRTNAPTPSLTNFVNPSEIRMFSVSSTQMNTFFTWFASLLTRNNLKSFAILKSLSIRREFFVPDTAVPDDTKSSAPAYRWNQFTEISKNVLQRANKELQRYPNHVSKLTMRNIKSRGMLLQKSVKKNPVK